MIEPFDIRERAEEIERASLSSWATLAAETKGRDRYEDPDPIRTAFQQDRDRLLHADAFARLAGTTHAFVPAETSGPAGEQPPWRSRLTHALATSQLARTIARALRLNEDLAEAIALGHPVGAPPYGLAGVRALAEATGGNFGVGEQSLRVVENLARDGRGLNLTWEVRDGLLHQSWNGASAATHEGQVARIACRFAGALHELSGALRAGVVHLDDVPSEVRTGLGPDHGSRVSTVVAAVVNASADRPAVGIDAGVDEHVSALTAFLDVQVHGRVEARAEGDRAVHALQALAIDLATNPEPLPTAVDHADVEQRVLDYLARATDREARAAFEARFVPRA